MTLKLDITLIKAEIEPQFLIKGNQIWFNLNCDGCQKSASTAAVPMERDSNFNSPCSFIITTADTMTAYIYVTICCFGSMPNQMIPLGRARSRIGKLPLNPTTPSNFQIPLMSTTEKDRKVATVLFVGTLAPLSSPGRATYVGQVPQAYAAGVPPQAYPMPGINQNQMMNPGMMNGNSGNGMPPMQYPGTPGNVGPIYAPPPHPYQGGMPPYAQESGAPNMPYGAAPNGSGPGRFTQPIPQPQPQPQPQPGSQGQMPPHGYPGPAPNQYGNNQPQPGPFAFPQNTPGADQMNVGGNQYYF